MKHSLTKITFISDTHDQHHLIPPHLLNTDILIHTGDFSTKSTFNKTEQFLFWLNKQPAKHKILLPGNHDTHIKYNPKLISLAHKLNIHLAHNTLLTINNIKIFGLHYTFYYKNNNYFYQNKLITKEQRYQLFSKIPKNLDILLTHQPPKNTLDLTINNENIGCDQLLLITHQKTPKYHIFGHVHELGGSTLHTTHTTYINASLMPRSHTTLTLDNITHIYI